MKGGPFELARTVAHILDDLGIDYVLGGSLASSLFGEPRATADADLAVRMDDAQTARLLERVRTSFYVPEADARAAVSTHSAFNLVDRDRALKVDIFVLGDTLLDRMQLSRRILIAIPGTEDSLWVTSPEDQVLRKLDWYRSGGEISDRQWRDIVGILRSRAELLDIEYLQGTAEAVGLSALLARALAQVGNT